MTFDREQYVRDYLHGQETPAFGGWIPPGLPGHTPDIGLPFDPVTARHLLAEAGYPGGKGFPALEMDWPEDEILGDLIAQSWQEELGIQIQPVLHPVFDPKIQEKYKNNSFCDQPAIIRLSWGADYPDPDNMLRVGLPEVALSEPRIHEKIEAARVMLDQAQRLEQYREADRILIKEAFVFPLIYGTANYLVSPRVQKFPLTLHWKDFIVEPDDAGC